MRIDAHQHFWRLSRGDYRWLTPELGPIYRDFMPDDLRHLLAADDIDATVLVQAAPSIAESEFLLGLADDYEFIAGVVGWIAMDEPSGLDDLESLAEHARLVGIRPMIQDIADETWVLKRELTGALEAISRLGLCFDALVLPCHLPYLIELASRHPDLRIVIDHCAKPNIASGKDWDGLESWRSRMRELAQDQRIHCKLSGLITEAGEQWTVDDLRPYVEHVIEHFGPNRVMWGSDWPVSVRAGGYDRWCDATHVLLQGLTEEQRNQILGETASRFYRLTIHRPLEDLE